MRLEVFRAVIPMIDFFLEPRRNLTFDLIDLRQLSRANFIYMMRDDVLDSMRHHWLIPLGEAA